MQTRMTRFRRNVAFRLICMLLLYGLMIKNLQFWSTILTETISHDLQFYRIVGENQETLPFEIPHKNQIDPDFRGSPKLILSWNNREFGQQHLNGCPDWNCRLVIDQQLVNDSQAIVFHNVIQIKEWPSTRWSNQYYVFFTQESPVYALVNQPYSGFYNLTMGYRRDADLPCPYGYVIERTRPLFSGDPNVYFREVLAKKRKFAAWLVSHCRAYSGRTRLVTELQRYIRVDIYGKCGNLSCPKGPECLRMIERDYKFYLAFENSICKDYLSEKFWRHMTTNVIVIVLKRSLVAPYVPKNSFIAVDDYPNIRAFADHLLQLDANDELYAKYLHWKVRYKAVFLDGSEHDIRERPWGFCRLCRTLWQKPLKSKIYRDILPWWEKDVCDDNLVDRFIGDNARQNK